MALLDASNSAVKSLKTPDDFIELYQKQLRDVTTSNNLQVSKVGFIGYFLHILGNLQFDVKQYYDFLFSEAFPITASQSSNLKLHSQLHNYDILNATPAKLVGNVLIKIDALNDLSTSVTTRKINIQNIKFWVDDLYYISESELNIEIVRKLGEMYYTCEVLTPTDQKLYTLNPLLPQVPITEIYQRQIETQNYFIPSYSYATHYVLEIPLEGLQLEKIELSVEGVIFEPRPTKLNSYMDDKVIFFEITSSGSLLLTTGSGIQGIHIPNKELEVTLITTKGQKGNIGKVDISNIEGTVSIVDYDLSFNILNIPVRIPTVGTVLTMAIDNGSNGKDILYGDELRRELIKHIQTKQNLVSFVDFKNTLGNIFEVYDVMFKKTDLVDNNIYSFVPIYDNFQVPIYTLTYNAELESFLNQQVNELIPYPQFSINNEAFMSPFVYKYNELHNRFDSFILNDNIVFNVSNVEVTEGIIESYPLIYLELIYDIEADETQINIKSFQPITEYIFRLLTPIKGLNTAVVEFDFDPINESHFIKLDGIISEKQTLYVKIFKTDLAYHDYLVRFDEVVQLNDITDYLNIKNYKFSASQITYALFIPLVKKEDFLLNVVVYKLKLLAQLTSLQLSINRMVSDDVQLRFLNSFYIRKEILKHYTLQNHDMDLTLPLKLDFDLIFHKDVVLKDKLDPELIVDELMSVLIEFLLEEKTGTSISFYKTELVDICHNYHFVKSVSIVLKDFNNQVIENGNIETIDFDVLVTKLNKQQILELTPHLFHWDVNNGINYKYTMT